MRALSGIVALAIVLACSPQPAVRPSALRYELPELRQYLPQRPPAVAVLAPGMPMRQDVLRRATELLGAPYVWGGNGAAGLDCSAYASLALETKTRHTTDTLMRVATMIEKDELLPGDLLNIETIDHPTKAGHVRVFAAWADAERTKAWVFESRYPDGAVYHVVSYDARYTPLRYDPLQSERGNAPVVEGASSR